MESLGDAEIKLSCNKCGSSEIVVSNGYEDDSVTSCNGCGHVFGLWPEVKAAAVKAAGEQMMDRLKAGFGKGWKFSKR